MKVFNSNRTGHVSAASFVGAITLATSAVTRNPLLATAAITIPFHELWFTCDNDINSRSAKRGPWIRRLWVMYWKPYAKLVAHRGKWSHSILPGTLARLVYGSALFWLPAVLIVKRFGLVWGDLAPWCWAVLAGCIVADVIHMLKDGYGLGEVFFGR